MDKNPKSGRSQITVFDHRGCAEHVNKEYTGPKAGNENDEMLVEVKQTKFNRDNPKFIDLANTVYKVHATQPLKAITSHLISSLAHFFGVNFGSFIHPTHLRP
jgi:hypothetical protein